MVLVRRAVEADWSSSKTIRLEALREAPLAFASTYAREVAFADDVWRSRIAESAQFLAVDERLEEAGPEAVPVGTATGFTDPTDPTTVLLVAMYVAPTARRTGVGEALVEAVVAQARADGARRVRLHVVETNPGAERLYTRCGFQRTGATMPLPHRPELVEQELQLLLEELPAAVS